MKEKYLEESKGVYSVVCNETGEIETQLYPGDRIVRASDDKDVIKGYNGDKKFVKLYDDITDELYDLLGNNNGMFTTTMRLSKFVCYTDCVLRHGGHGHGKVLDVKDLTEELNMPYSTLKKHLNVLYSVGVLAYCKTGTKGNPGLISDCIIANPDVFMRGANVNSSVVAVFRNSGWSSKKSSLDLLEESQTNDEEDS